MAKKSFKGGLDNLLASAGIKKKVEENKLAPKKEVAKVKELSDDEKHWLLIKNENLLKELSLWRTGKLSISEFEKSLNKNGLKYISNENEIIEL